MLILRYIAAFFNIFGLSSLIWYPFDVIFNSTASVLKTTSVVIPSLLIYSAFAVTLIYTSSKQLRANKKIWNTGFACNAIGIVILFAYAAHVRITSSEQTAAVALEFARLLLPYIAILATNLFLLFKGADSVH